MFASQGPDNRLKVVLLNSDFRLKKNPVWIGLVHVAGDLNFDILDLFLKYKYFKYWLYHNLILAVVF